MPEAGPPGMRHRKRGQTNKARLLRQEAQRRQGHWEGGQVQARGWMQEAGPASDTASSNGPCETRNHSSSGWIRANLRQPLLYAL